MQNALVKVTAARARCFHHTRFERSTERSRSGDTSALAPGAVAHLRPTGPDAGLNAAKNNAAERRRRP